MAKRTVVVIGAGIIGCLVASELARRDPAARITVVDRDGIGSGASRRSAGLHLLRGATPRTRRMSARSHAYYADLASRLPGAPIRQVAATVLSSGPHGGRYLDLARPAPSVLPHGHGVAARAGQTAWRIDGCHHADVYALCGAVAAQLRPRVRFLEGVEVTGLTPRPDSVLVRCGTGQRLAADAVVLAPGPWLAAPAWRDLVAPLGLRVKKIVALHVERRPGPGDELVVFDDEDAFLLPLPGRGHWLFSYTCTEWDVEPDALTSGLTAANVEEARACLRRYSPALAAVAAAGRVFCDAYSPDGEPVVRAVDDAGLMVFAGAANGSGYRLAPAIGSDAAGLLCGPPANPTPT